MQVESPDKIRNIALAGHNDTGKTTLTSAMLYTSGVTNRFLRVEDGNTLTDFDSEEVARRISIGLSACFAPWRGHKLNLLDTPGYGIFFNETKQALRAADTVALCVNGVAGLEVNAEKVFEYAREIELPVLVVLTKMDRERADLERAVESLRRKFGREVVPVQLPIGRDQSFSGVVDLVEGKAYQFDRDGNGAAKEVPVPEEMSGDIEEARSKLVEAVAETDDSLMEQFFESGSLPQEDLRTGLRAAIAARRIFPVVLTAGGHNIGTGRLLDTFVDLLPSPVDRVTFPASNVAGEMIQVATGGDEPLTALVFKTLSDPFTGKISIMRIVSGTMPSDATVWNSRTEESERLGHTMVLQGKQGTAVPRLVTGDIGGIAKLKATRSGDTLCVKERPVRLAWIHVAEPAISYAIEPKAKGDEEKIGEALTRMMEEDLALRAGRDPQTGENLISGTGQLHVEIAVAKLRSRYHVDVILHPPKVPYRETIRAAAEGHGRHKKQTGGRGQFADCKIKIEPLERGGDFAFVDEIFGGAIPHNFRPAVEKGIQEARRKGYLAGYPMVDFKVRLIDGQYHDVDSSELAFKIAGSLAYKDAMAKARPTILEPIMKVEIETTEEFTGDIISDLSQRRGRPQGMDSANGTQIIRATVPMSEMLNYAPALRSMTQGRSSFHLEFSHYEEVPKLVQDKIIAEAAKHKEEEAEH